MLTFSSLIVFIMVMCVIATQDTLHEVYCGVDGLHCFSEMGSFDQIVSGTEWNELQCLLLCAGRLPDVE